MKRKRENEIIAKEKEVKELQKARFGVDGELFKKRQELIKPIQDKVYKAIQDMAESKVYDFVFDKSNGVAMLFATPKYDRSDDILKALGVTNLTPAANTTTAPSTSTKPSTTTKPAPAEEKKTGIDMRAPGPDSKTSPNKTVSPATPK
jgi:hypothetical protein